MRRGLRTACAVAVAVLTLAVGAPGQAAGTPAPRVTVRVSPAAVTSGHEFTVRSRADVTCDWVVEFRGRRQHTVGRANSSTFVAPEVTRPTRFRVRVTCVLHPSRSTAAVGRSTTAYRTAGAVEHVLARVPPLTRAEAPVSVYPGGAVEPPHAPGSGLPDTGGPPSRLVVAGVFALLLGSVLVRRGRPSPQPSLG